MSRRSSLPFREATAEMLEKYDDEFRYEELAKLAIDYSDGIIEAGEGISGELLNYTTTNNKPLLSYPGEDFGDAYEAFYEKICGE